MRHKFRTVKRFTHVLKDADVDEITDLLAKHVLRTYNGDLPAFVGASGYAIRSAVEEERDEPAERYAGEGHKPVEAQQPEVQISEEMLNGIVPAIDTLDAIFRAFSEPFPNTCLRIDLVQMVFRQERREVVGCSELKQVDICNTFTPLKLTDIFGDDSDEEEAGDRWKQSSYPRVRVRVRRRATAVTLRMMQCRRRRHHPKRRHHSGHHHPTMMSPAHMVACAPCTHLVQPCLRQRNVSLPCLVVKLLFTTAVRLHIRPSSSVRMTSKPAPRSVTTV
mmetsp:Transcript_21161/g.42990  ORF Transcript_21161/g.42990 Transcript_21161/m.42990 type:complete len:277 (-) Transcript_21161:71-901(-)